MITSDLITEKVMLPNDGGIDFDKLVDMWKSVRYYMARKPLSNEYSKTTSTTFKGHAIFPGPKANPKIMPLAMNNDLAVMSRSFGISFVNFDATSDADDDTRLSPWVWLEDAEADEYEAIMLGKKPDGGIDQVGKKPKIEELIDFDSKPKKANSKTAK